MVTNIVHSGDFHRNYKDILIRIPYPCAKPEPPETVCKIVPQELQGFILIRIPYPCAKPEPPETVLF